MDILMPQLGETVSEGKIIRWFKDTGDEVKPGENLFEIETDKVSMEVPAISAGTLSEIRVPAGESAKVGAVVAVLGGDGAAPAAKPPAQADANPPAPSPPAAPSAPAAARGSSLQTDRRAPSGPPKDFAYPDMDAFFEVRTPERNYGPAKQPSGHYATPLARRLAGERGIDLSRVSGSGPHGRIVAADVEAAVPSGSSAPAAMPAAVSADAVKALYQGVEYEELPLDGMRRTIAIRLTEAKQSVPHFYLTSDVELDALLALRKTANEGAPVRDGEPVYRLSVNDFVIKALALALQRVPAANAVWAGDRILRFARSDIGVAVAIDGGLLTPVLRNADQKALSAISMEMRDLAARARDKRLKPEEYQGGVSAVSNLGMHGVREFSAIINPPQSTILAVGAVHRAPVETEQGSVRFVSRMTVTLSCDHRVVDGALGAELLAAFRDLLDNPVRMLV